MSRGFQRKVHIPRCARDDNRGEKKQVPRCPAGDSGIRYTGAAERRQECLRHGGRLEAAVPRAARAESEEQRD